MKIIIRLTVFTGVLALTSCTTSLVSEDSGKSGYIVVSLREKIVEQEASLGFPSVTTVTFRRVGASGNATISNRLPQASGYTRPDFGDEKTSRGQVFVLKLPAGAWRFDGWKLSYGGPWTIEFFNEFAPLTFEVRPGVVSYIGSVEMSYSVMFDRFNAAQVEHVSIALADQSAANVPAVKQRYPNLAVKSVQLDVISTSSDLATLHGAQ